MKVLESKVVFHFLDELNEFELFSYILELHDVLGDELKKIKINI